MKRWITTLLSLALLLAVCAGCGKDQDQDPNGDEDGAPANILASITGIDPNEIVMTVDGNEIPAQIYFFWLNRGCSSIEHELQYYNMYYFLYGDMFDEAGNLLWNTELPEGFTPNEYAVDNAENTVKYYAALENFAARYNVSLTEEDQAAIDEELAYMVGELGSEEALAEQLALLGIDQAAYRRISGAEYLFGHLVELAQEEGSALYLSPEGYDQLATYADHILLMTIDQSTREPLSEEEIAAQYALAQDILAQLRAAEDLETLFAQLADQYSEDTGRFTNPTGYIYTPGTMVTEFEDAAAALDPGQISDIVETVYGYHILLRKDLQQGLEEYPEQRAALAEDYIYNLVTASMDDSVTVPSEKLAAIDAGAVYTAYLAAVDAKSSAE